MNSIRVRDDETITLQRDRFEDRDSVDIIIGNRFKITLNKSTATLISEGLANFFEDNPDFMCEDCECIIPEVEYEMFSGKCEECSIEY